MLKILNIIDSFGPSFSKEHGRTGVRVWSALSKDEKVNDTRTDAELEGKEGGVEGEGETQQLDESDNSETCVRELYAYTLCQIDHR